MKFGIKMVDEEGKLGDGKREDVWRILKGSWKMEVGKEENLK